MTIARIVLRWLLGAAYLAAGVLHLVNPPPFLRITPGWVPFPTGVVAFTGIAEVLGAIGLVQGFHPRCAAPPDGVSPPMRCACGRPTSTICLST